MSSDRRDDSTPKQYKTINDPVHGTILLHPLLIKIIDTSYFQRLRNIKQLGVANYVYPGAQHSRFEHSIGTAHLAGKLVRHLNEVQAELNITPKDILCVEIAGLCHDLGHGPFSRFFADKFVRRVRLSDELIRENKSCTIFDKLVETIRDSTPYRDAKLEEKDEKFIKEMIAGPFGNGRWPYEGRAEKKGFLYEIVSNKENGVDVDKFDYLARDCHHLGIANGFDHNRFIQFTRALEFDGKMRLCVRDKEIFNLYELFHTRFALHKRAYQHKVVHAVEHMLCDAMDAADGIVRLSANIDEDEYCQLDDGIFQKILYSENEDCDQARKLLQRIITRDLYKCVGDKILSESQKSLPVGTIINELRNGIKTKSSKADIEFAVSVVVFNYGRESKNPIENFPFYTKDTPNDAELIAKEKVSLMLPEIFEERRIQVFSKSSDKESERESKVVQKAFDEWYVKPEPNVTAAIRSLVDGVKNLEKRLPEREPPAKCARLTEENSDNSSE